MTAAYTGNPNLTTFLLSCLQDWGIESLTDIQEKAVAEGVALGASAIICAPTSSGKTLIGELALANALSGGFNALYLVSHKTLAEQKYSDLGKRFSSAIWKSAVTVAISTGDREEGDVNCRLLISTYEKALGLLLAGRMKPANTVIIADELQLLGEDGRGASVETLLALLRQRQPHQFVGLTATVENPQDLAGWLNCKSIRSNKRDTELLQMIRYGGQLYTIAFGQDEGSTVADPYGSADLNGIIRRMIADELGPVLVFTETRAEARQYANSYAATCQKSADGVEVSEQLELFSEPTESSQQLKSQAECKVTFHSADLTPDERTVIEEGFANSRFNVCFATSTLAAGVNFPFRTVIFPKLTYEFRDGKPFTKAEFRNMSGRAGRLGLHPDGRALLLPKNEQERRHANHLVSPENDRVISQLVNLSMRRTVLALVAARAVLSKPDLTIFFENTFYWHQTLENNPKLLETILAKAMKALEWLLENGFIEESHSIIQTTPLGKSTSLSGLLPETAKRFGDLLKSKAGELMAKFPAYEVSLIHWVATCPEFSGDFPSRFLPYPSGQMKPESSVYLSKVPHLTAWDRADETVTRCVQAMGLFIQGELDRKITFATGISAGNLYRLSTDVAWVIDGLSCVSGSADLGCPQGLTNQLSMLARRVRWGTPVEALDVLRIANRKSVPGFGRQRVMALLTNGLSTVMEVITAGKDFLSKLLGSRRADALVAALSDTFDGAALKLDHMHLQLGQELGIAEKVANCNNALGTEYDLAIENLLREESSWIVTRYDDGKRQNVFDIILQLGKTTLAIECKTVTKKPPLIGKDEAFAVLQKAADFDEAARRITVGKPDFDETSKKKAAASTEITLVRHDVFMEGLMRVLTGRLKAQDFVAWLAEPGITDLSRLPGTPTYAQPEVEAARHSDKNLLRLGSPTHS